MRSKLMLNGLFEVFDDGRINRLRGNTTAPAAVSFTGRGKKYAVVSYMENGKQKHIYVHRLVAEAFLPNPNHFPQVNHIDGNTKNNCVLNLEWCTAQHNITHAYANGLINPYRNNRACVHCGKQISDSNHTGLCPMCATVLKEADKYRLNKVFVGIVEYHKCINGMTNSDIAAYTGYAKETIDSFLCGKRMSKNVAYKICELFSIDKSCFVVS